MREDRSDTLPPVNPDQYRHVFREVMIGDEDQPGVLKQFGLSVKKLAELSGIHRPTIQHYISGRWFPTPLTASKLAKALDIPWEEFRKHIVMREYQSYFPNLIVFGEVREDKAKRDFYKRRAESIKAHEAAKEQADQYGVRCGVILPPLRRSDKAIKLGTDDDRDLLRRISERDALAA